jgi:beta-glucosidase
MAVIFPSNFLWGSSTAAHQVEGRNLNSDWWEWEQRGGKIKNGDSSLLACDWWGRRYRQDFERARQLGQNALRLSVEWSRLEPHEGEWNKEAVRVYRDMLTTLRELGLTPLVTLHHFTNPRWLAAQGGWANPAVVRQFAGFATRVVAEIGDLCNFWITLNEPNTYSCLSYAGALWPPQQKNIRSALRVLKLMVDAHAAAYHAIKQIQPDSQIGVAHHFRMFFPRRPNSPFDRFAARMRDHVFNRLALYAIEEGRLPFPLGTGQALPEARGTQDFIGVNYYYSEKTTFDLAHADQLFGRTALSPWAHKWQSTFAGAADIDPGGLELLLGQLARNHKPVYVTENGIFEAEAECQSNYLVAHVKAVRRALQAGVPVKGYFWWTLVDNFEWTEGYSPRFGLYHLDHATQRRAARPVAAVYARLIEENRTPERCREHYQRVQAWEEQCTSDSLPTAMRHS